MPPTYELDSPDRYKVIQAALESKTSLRKLYQEFYGLYRESLAATQKLPGLAIELGSGAGFAKSELPELKTTDLIPYPGLDLIVDATKMPFQPGEVRFVGMMNVLHHIPDSERFFSECERVLIPGGRVRIIDQNRGWISTPILKWVHHEGFDSSASDWKFQSEGPLSSANGALAWIVFFRDREKFSQRFPKLKILGIHVHTPLRYWLTGGLKAWSLLPPWAWPAATWLDRQLVRLSPHFGSFLDVEIERIA